MNRRDEEALAAQIEADLDNPDAWENDPAPSPPSRRTLGSVISVRLDPELAESVRNIAAAKGVRYTSLIRTWIIDQVERDSALVTVPGILEFDPPVEVTGAAPQQFTSDLLPALMTATG